MADHDPLFHDDMPLGEARSVLRGLVDDGARCPCCTQLAKVYARKINSGQAAGLIRFYRNVGALRFAHLPTLGLSSLGGEFARLRFWGLVEEEPVFRSDGGRAGYWRVTVAGEAFVLGRLEVQKYARIYDGRCLGLTGPPVSIVDALGDRFSYTELMARPEAVAA